MIQHMLQKGASCTSLLVESGSLPAAASAPKRKQLGRQKASNNKLGVSNHLGLSKLLLSGLEAIKLCNGWVDLSLNFTD